MKRTFAGLFWMGGCALALPLSAMAVAADAPAADGATVAAQFGALRKAGKASALIVYKGLDHQLPDAAARTDMLAKSDAFLREKLKM